MQVAGDAVAVLEQHEALNVLAVLGQLEPDSCLGRERDHHFHRWR